MRNTDGAECDLTHEAIEARLQHAYVTLFKLPKDGGQRLKVATYGYVSEAVDMAAEKLAPVRIKATALDITLMDEAMSWPSLIANLTARRIVSARAMVHPVTERHLHQWKRLAGALGADYRAVQRWHRQGIAEISEKLWQEGH